MILLVLAVGLLKKHKIPLLKKQVWMAYTYIVTASCSRDTMPCLEICKGLFFFIYCPLLPLWWVVDFIWEYGKTKWRRHKRKKRYRARKAAMRAEEEQTFLMLDKYTRGKVERQIVDFDQQVRERKEKKANKGGLGDDTRPQSYFRQYNCNHWTVYE